MLDYAVNGVEYWPIDRLRQAAAETAQGRGETLDDVVRRLIGDEGGGEDADGEDTVELFWKLVESNLLNGRVRLIFVADETPRELRRLVEFLNQKMADIEVLAVDIKQFLGSEGQKVLVPRVIGRTEMSPSKRAPRSSSTTGRTNRERFLTGATNGAVGRFFETIENLSREYGHTIDWGTQGFSVKTTFPGETKPTGFFWFFPDGRVNVLHSNLKLAEPEMRN